MFTGEKDKAETSKGRIRRSQRLNNEKKRTQRVRCHRNQVENVLQDEARDLLGRGLLIAHVDGTLTLKIVFVNVKTTGKSDKSNFSDVLS